MKDFFIKLLTAGSGLSSNRFIKIAVLPLFYATIIACWFKAVPAFAVWAVVTVLCGSAAMTSLDKYKDIFGKIFNKKGDANTPPSKEDQTI